MAEAFFTVALRAEGVLLVRGRFSFPREEEMVVSLAKRAEAWLRGDLFDHARLVYDRDPRPKKRFFFPCFAYSFAARPTEDGGIALLVTLSREGKELSRYETHLRRRHGLLAPPKRKR